jgi:hypothetical protein
MVDEYTLGHKRMKLLNDADSSYSAGEYLVCQRILENFIATIREDTPESKDLAKRFDDIELLKKTAIQKLEKEYGEDAGYFEKGDARVNRERLEINEIHDIKTACWIVTLKYNLYYEK